MISSSVNKSKIVPRTTASYNPHKTIIPIPNQFIIKLLYRLQQLIKLPVIRASEDINSLIVQNDRVSDALGVSSRRRLSVECTLNLQPA